LIAPHGSTMVNELGEELDRCGWHGCRRRTRPHYSDLFQMMVPTLCTQHDRLLDKVTRESVDRLGKILDTEMDDMLDGLSDGPSEDAQEAIREEVRRSCRELDCRK